MNDLPNPNPASSPANPYTGDRLEDVLEDLAAQAPFRCQAQPAAPGSFVPSGVGACPDLGQWLELACDGVSEDKKKNLLAHAALCTGCLTRLREIQRVVNSDVSTEELAGLQQYASTTQQWQHRLAVELARTPRKAARSFWASFPLWTSAGLATALIAITAFAIMWRRENEPERLLAQAYSESRSFDLRVPGAGFAPVTPQNHLRGSATDHASAPLLSARANIEQHLAKAPSDAYWLQLKARAELLDEHYDAAVDILDRLVDAGPVTASLLVDDGSAYFLRGTASASENDRATALDYLRRADEMAPGDPIVLFNEALVMEDRGQVMNAVETWNRYLKFERDPLWQAEGRAHLDALQQKLNRIKTHASRMEQHLATPQAMRDLAADPATLASLDEELSSTLLPKILEPAFPLPGDRSRGSPCDDRCASARTLLHALAASLQANHQDSWLTDTLPSDPNPNLGYINAAHALARAITANARGDYASAEQAALQSQLLFQNQNNEAGAERAEAERVYSLDRSYTFAACHSVVHAVFNAHRHYGWIDSQVADIDTACDLTPGTATADNPHAEQALKLAREHHYALLEMRAGMAIASPAMDAGDAETVWRSMLAIVRKFYAGDYPPYRIANTIGGLAGIEETTPRAQLALLLHREAFHFFEMSQNRANVISFRGELIRAAIRAGSLREASEQMALAKKETVFTSQQKGLRGAQAESEVQMADLYLDHGDLPSAAQLLDAAQNHMIGEDNDLQLSEYAEARAELELALGHSQVAESTLRSAILQQESEARGAGRGNIALARQNRALYAALAGVWLAEGRPGIDILSLWERYRLRILGKPVPTCANHQLDCLASDLKMALHSELPASEHASLLGQVILHDRVLLYKANANQVTWSQSPVGIKDVLAAAASLGRVTGSPTTSQASVDSSARRFGDLALALLAPGSTGDLLVLEPDPLLGNIPWPAVETAQGALGMQNSLIETPSVLLQRQYADTRSSLQASLDHSLIVGASIGAGESEPLPEVLNEARAVAQYEKNPYLLLAKNATTTQIVPHLASATAIHFAGHATEYNGQTRLLLAPATDAVTATFLDSNSFLRNPPRAARLIVFSACSTGKREEGWNHDMGDIVDTLAYLGVPDVVSTRWKIDSGSAVSMMNIFYGGLSHGLAVPQALTLARQTLIRDTRYSHPYYWAAYYASGVGNYDAHEVIHGEGK